MMIKKVDFFMGKRDFSAHVAEFMRCKIWKKAIQLEFQKKIEDAQDDLRKIEQSKLLGSIFAEKLDEAKVAGLAQIALLEQQRDEQIKAEAKFELSDADKELKKALKNASGSADLIANAVIAFFAEQGLEVEETYFLDEILDDFGKKFDFKTFVATQGQDARALDVNRALEMVYCASYTHMLRVGTIKPAQIPEIVREKFAPKQEKKNKKSKKEEK